MLVLGNSSDLGELHREKALLPEGNHKVGCDLGEGSLRLLAGIDMEQPVVGIGLGQLGFSSLGHRLDLLEVGSPGSGT